MTDLFGKALLDYQNRHYSHDLFTETQASEKEILPLPYLFRNFNDMPLLEKVALQNCKGKVLDIGCGAGSHSLYLQKQGFEVTAIDYSEGAVMVCKQRGVETVFQKELLDFSNEKFDTLLLLMNGTGIFKQFQWVDKYLAHLKTLLQPNGQILIDSSDLQYLYPKNNDGSIWVPADRYYGELTFTLYYKDYQPQQFDWLYLDPNSLQNACKRVGLQCHIITKGDNYDYLAKITVK